MEKLRKKKSKIFPTVISMLAGITYEKLKNAFPEDVNIIKTAINHKIISEYDEIYHTKNYPSNENDDNIKSNKEMKQVDPNLRSKILGHKADNLQQSQINNNKSECN